MKLPKQIPCYCQLRWWCVALPIALCCALLGGCQGSSTFVCGTFIPSPTKVGLTPLEANTAVAARCAPPVGWKAEPLKSSEKRQHQIWISPSGSTAFGVIRFSLPLPMTEDFVLPFFLSAMRQSEGEATLLEKSRDDEHGGLRFTAEGGLYRMHSRLEVHGRTGWAIYAASMRNQAVNPEELHLAELAREYTRAGLGK